GGSNPPLSAFSKGPIRVSHPLCDPHHMFAGHQHHRCVSVACLISSPLRVRPCLCVRARGTTITPRIQSMSDQSRATSSDVQCVEKNAEDSPKRVQKRSHPSLLTKRLMDIYGRRSDSCGQYPPTG